MKLLATHFTGSIGYYLLLMQTWVVTYMHACTNETYSLANLQDLIPTLASIIIGNTRYCTFAKECVSFVHVWM